MRFLSSCLMFLSVGALLLGPPAVSVGEEHGDANCVETCDMHEDECVEACAADDEECEVACEEEGETCRAACE